MSRRALYAGDRDLPLTYPELVEWEEDYNLEPWGETRQDLRAGVIASAVLAPHMKKGRSPPRPSDFVLRFDRKPARPQQKMENMKAQVHAFLKATGQPTGKSIDAKE